jgi:hypothetical protein
VRRWVFGNEEGQFIPYDDGSHRSSASSCQSSEYLRLCRRFMDLAHVRLSHHLVHRRSRLVLEKLISDEP